MKKALTLPSETNRTLYQTHRYMEELTYTQAVAELEDLVKKMQDPQCSIDNLSEYTKRSKELLEVCRKKLTATDEALKTILNDIEVQNQ